jgi:KipI family sensor histidine kinase inhibitor
MATDQPATPVLPLLQPLGDCGLLVRFGTTLSDAANRRTIALARRLRDASPEGVTEIAPNLVSVLLKYDPARIDFDRLAGEVRLLLWDADDAAALPGARHQIAVRFGGEYGPDLDTAAAALELTPAAFVAAHNAAPLRVLTTGFAPGFVYCGFHPDSLRLPRRASVRPQAAPGSVLFAAGQTAITSTPIPTGWHVIGRTEFRNFDQNADPPTLLREGDMVHFAALPP